MSNLVQWMPLEKKFSGHVIKDQGQTADLYPSTHYFMIFCLMVTKLVALVDFRKKIIPNAFWVTRSRSNDWASSQHCPLNIYEPFA